MSLINKIKKNLEKLFKKREKKLTLKEAIDFIDKSYYFSPLNDNLVDEIYTILLDYGSVKIAKVSDDLYIVEITQENKVSSFNITEIGISTINTKYV